MVGNGRTLLAALLAVGGYLVFNPKLTEYIVGGLEAPRRDSPALHGQRADVTVVGRHGLGTAVGRGLRQPYEAVLESRGDRASNCTASVEWTLPADLFSDPWRAADAGAVADTTDVEAPTHRAAPQRVRLETRLGGSVRIGLALQGALRVPDAGTPRLAPRMGARAARHRVLQGRGRG